jgi:hypothetical protein
MSASILHEFRGDHKCCKDRGHGAYCSCILYYVDYFIQVQLGVVKRHVIHGVRDEPQGGAPYDVLAKKGPCPEGSLSQGVPDDPSDYDAYLGARLCHLTRLVLIDAKEYPGGYVTRFFHGRRRIVLPDHTFSSPVGRCPKIRIRVYHDLYKPCSERSDPYGRKDP